MPESRPQTPQQAWQAMLAGNQRFVSDTREHPNQDVDRRNAVAQGQVPFAALFGCADSRLSAEIIFDAGLGDLFVVRNAGQVIGETVLGSLEYAVEVLKVPLILVLGHDECGAVRAAINAYEGNLNVRGEFIHHLVAAIQPTVTRSNAAGNSDIDSVTEMHVEDTIQEMLAESKVIAEAIEAGALAVVGAKYKLSGGEVSPLIVVGNA